MVVAPVLYVEDEQADIMLARLAFHRVGIGHPLQAVTNGEKAIDYLVGTGPYGDREKYPPPCLVLLDLNLPRKSGMEVLQWIRSQVSYKSLPVVIYTSSSNEGDRKRARELGANDYFVKSMYISETDKLLQSIKNKWLSSVSLQ